ncbi:MAG: hypothetical protein M1832_006221 [Thelocarpon impressellum]|nr:MAG: hypothetical protein M1832_006221 [Thelocarpon impressellum]
MNASGEASAFTNTLLSTIRLQRHLNARIIISTQEPTISPALLDLSSSTIVHRFTSPEWFHSLKRHLAAAASDLLPPDGETDRDDNHDGRFKGKDSVAKRIFDDVVKLRVGEALLFSPSAMVALDTGEGGDTMARRLGAGYLKIRVRARVTADGGKSVMAC